MTEEEKKAEFENWENTNARWIHFQLSIGRVREIMEKAFIEALNIGFARGIKTKVNTTTISDAPLTERERLEQAKEIIKKLRVLYFSPVVTNNDVKRQDEILNEVEQFLKEEV